MRKKLGQMNKFILRLSGIIGITWSWWAIHVSILRFFFHFFAPTLFFSKIFSLDFFMRSFDLYRCTVDNLALAYTVLKHLQSLLNPNRCFIFHYLIVGGFFSIPFCSTRLKNEIKSFFCCYLSKYSLYTREPFGWKLQS